MEISLYPTYNVLSKMIYADPELRSDIMCIGGTSQWPADVLPRHSTSGASAYGYLPDRSDRRGDRRILLPPTASRPAVSRGRRSASCRNIEHTEQLFPMLIL